MLEGECNFVSQRDKIGKRVERTEKRAILKSKVSQRSDYIMILLGYVSQSVGTDKKGGREKESLNYHNFL